MSRRLLWQVAAGLAAGQALFGLVTLVWPSAPGADALMVRLLIWQAAPVWLLQLFLGVPILAVLIWRGRGGLARGLLGLSLAATLALPGLLLAETAHLHAMFLDASVTNPNRTLRLLSLARWADAGLGLAALIALRLAARAEALQPETASPNAP
jgi:hypothetical protein